MNRYSKPRVGERYVSVTNCLTAYAESGVANR
jgi:hypothetical protein